MAGLQNFNNLANIDSANLNNLLGNNTFNGLSNFSSTGTGSSNGNWMNTLFGNNDGGLVGGLGNLASIGLGGLQAYTGLQSLGLGKKALGLAKNQFAFEKGLANRNLANQAKTINNAYDASAQVAAGLIGGKDATGRYTTTNQEIIDKYASSAKDKYVDGSAIA